MDCKLTISFFLAFISWNFLVAQPVAVKDSFVVYGTESAVYIDPRINDYDPDGDSIIICGLRDLYGLVSLYSDTCIKVIWYWESFLQYRICKANDTNSVSEWTDLYINRQRTESAPFCRFDELHISPFDTVWFNPCLNDSSTTGNELILSSASTVMLGYAGFFNKISGDSAMLTYQFNQVDLISIDTIYYSYKLYDSAQIIGRPWDMGILRVIMENNQWFGHLDVNNISARFNCRGNHFWNMYDASEFFYPKGTSETVSFVQSIWIGGLEINGNDTIVHSSGEKNDLRNTQFNFGPISSEYTLENQQKWFHAWKLNKKDIEYHQQHWWLPDYQMLKDIATWPGNGNPDLGQAAILAPFEDLNQNGMYEPWLGEFPKIRGDQSVFFIFNDENDARDEDVKNYLGVEFQGMAYAYNDSTNNALMNTVFLHYDIINRSDIDYYDTYIGNFNDANIGFLWDDYIASNVDGAYFYFFNGDSFDGPEGLKFYGNHPPSFAAKFLRGPLMDSDGVDNPDNQCDASVNGLFFGDGIVDNERYGMTSFITIQGSFAQDGIPTTNMDHYNYLRAKWRDNTSLMYGGVGYYADPDATEYEARFMFPDPESDSCWWNTNGVELGVWTEFSENNPPYSRRGISAAGPFTFPAGAVQSIDLAFIVGPPMDSIPQSIDTLNMYSKILTALMEADSSFFEMEEYKPVVEDDVIVVYPNPAKSRFYIDMHKIKSEAAFRLYDINGSLIQSGSFKPQRTNELNLGRFAPNLYFLSLLVDGKYRTFRLLKTE